MDQIKGIRISLLKKNLKSQETSRTKQRLDKCVYLIKIATMNIEARKIEFIQEFLKLQSEEAISKLEKVLLKERTNSENVAKPMSAKEMNRRIDQSMEDSENGRLTEANDLLAEIEKWD